MTLTTRKSPHTRLAAIITLVFIFGAGIFLYVLNSNRVTPKSPLIDQSKPMVKKTATDATFGLPVRLLIPKLGVDANITYMGLTTGGDMDVPPDLVNVGWYKYGTKPGDVGSAVIAGHLEGTKDLGVFIDLNKLRAGDIVKVRNDRAETISFTVRETRTYKQDERPSEIFNKTDNAHLNLITCTGIWSNSQHRYSHRLVVFTDKTVK